MKDEGYIYLLQSEKDHSFYFGSTNDINRREKEHAEGKSVSTKSRKPWKLVHSVKFDDIKQARKIEQILKSRKEKISIEWFLETIGKYQP